MTKKDELKNRVLNGGRGSGRTFRLLCEVYENKIADLQHKVDTLQGFLDHDIEYDMDKTIQEQKIKIEELEKENATLKKQLEALSGDIPWNKLKDVSEVTKQLTEVKEILQTVLDKWKEERWILQSDEEIKQIENLMKQAENFLKE